MSAWDNSKNSDPETAQVIVSYLHYVNLRKLWARLTGAVLNWWYVHFATERMYPQIQVKLCSLVWLTVRRNCRWFARTSRKRQSLSSVRPSIITRLTSSTSNNLGYIWNKSCPSANERHICVALMPLIASTAQVGKRCWSKGSACSQCDWFRAHCIRLINYSKRIGTINCKLLLVAEHGPRRRRRRRMVIEVIFCPWW